MLKSYKFKLYTSEIEENFLLFCADIETTGLNTVECEAVELAAVSHTALSSENEVSKEFSCLIKPKIVIPSDVIKIHGITNESVEFEAGFNVRIAQFIEFLSNLKTKAGADKVLLIFHNGFGFDIPILKKLCAKNNIAFPGWVYGSDTLPMLDAVFPGRFAKIKGSRTLANLSRLYGKKEPSHRALSDTVALSSVLHNLGETTEVLDWLLRNCICLL